LVIRHLDNIELEAFPKNLPDQVTVDATVLEKIGDKLHVSDINTIEGVTILTEPEAAIATIEETKAQMSEESAKKLPKSQPKPLVAPKIINLKKISLLAQTSRL
jgi:hypothetical protein